MKAGSSSVAWTSTWPPHAGIRCTVRIRIGPAPSDRAACTYSRLRSPATIARTPFATNGHPTSDEDPRHQQEHGRRRQHQRQHRAQHQHHVDHRQHQHEVRDPHDRVVDPAAAIPRPRAGHHADQDRAERGDQRQANRGAGAVQQPRQHVAAEVVRAQQKYRGRAVAFHPWQPHRARSIRLEALLETIGEHQRVHHRRHAVEVRPHRRRVQELAERLARLVRRQHRRDHRQRRQRRQEIGGAPNHARSPERTRGSM